MIKQHITDEQWNELSDDQKDIFRKIVAPENVSYVGSGSCNECGNTLTPNIGQMIAFLIEESSDYRENSYIDCNFTHSMWSEVEASGKSVAIGWDADLCDSLWNFVKEVINKKRYEKNLDQ